MILNELAAASMTEEDIIEIVKRSCKLRGAKLISVNCNIDILQLVVLVEGDIYIRGAVSLDVDSALCGFADPITFEYIDNELSDNVKGPCPNVMVISNAENYDSIILKNGGNSYEF